MLTLEQFQAMTPADQAKMLAVMQAKRAAKLTIKVSDKGAVSVYGLGKWPVTLYRSQWESLLGAADAIREFINANAHALASKE